MPGSSKTDQRLAEGSKKSIELKENLKTFKAMEIRKIENRLRNIIVISGMLCVYMLLISNFFPHGFVTYLTKHLWKWMLALMLISGVIFFLWNFKKGRSVVFVKKIENFEFRDLILLLLPMTPIVQYIIFNNESLSAADIFLAISFFLFLLFIFAYLIPWILSIFASRRILMYVAIFYFF